MYRTSSLHPSTLTYIFSECSTYTAQWAHVCLLVRCVFCEGHPSLCHPFLTPTLDYLILPSSTHIRWNGSNTNPQDNAGQGKAGTDRSNMVLLRPPNYLEGNGQAGPSNGHWGNSYPAHLDSAQTLLGWPRADRQSLAVLDIGQCTCMNGYTST